MKKTEITLLILTFLFHTSAFSMDIDETNSASVIKIKSSKKRANAPTETAPGWYSSNNKIKIKHTMAKEIGDFKVDKFKAGKLYGYIDPSFTNPQLEMALDKGFTATAKGTNGVKFINGNVLELKINGDERLYTTEVHQNDLGDYIAIFNHSANHKEMKKIANKKNNFKVHADCFFYPQE